MSDRDRGSAHSPTPGGKIGRLLAAGFFVTAGVGLLGSLMAEARHPWSVPAPGARATADASRASLAEGARLYQQDCAVCHGATGYGNGPAANVLDPKPRDFHVGRYRLISTSNGVPLRDDVIRTIRHGAPGTSMPAWAHLSDGEVGAVADYVLSISRESLKEQLRAKLFANSKLKPDALEKKLEKMVSDRLAPEDPAHPGPRPAFTAADLEQARTLFAQACVACHGADGRGMKNPEWKTEEGFPIASRNFRAGVFKGGGRGTDIYNRIYAGIPGTPMPSFASLPEADIWRLVSFVQGMAVPDGVEPYVLTAPPTNPAAAPATQASAARTGPEEH